jgi:hypothetical protein
MWNYSSENYIVNNGFMNINATVTGDMLVWQSNKNGNWDMYYSLWNGTGWSAPLIIDSTSANETRPNLYFSSYYQPTYYLAFERDNDVCFKYFRFNTWQGDTNLTGTISNKCFSPSYYGQRIYYLREISAGFNKLALQNFGITYPQYQLIWYPVDSLPRPSTIKSIHTSEEFHYEYDTLGNTQSYMVYNHASKLYRNVTLGFSGKNTNAVGEVLGIPVIDFPPNNFSPYSVFGFLRRTADSNMVVAQSRTENGIYTTKYYNLEDTSFVSKIAASPPLTSTWSYFKLRLVWEKKINGRIALVETFDTQLITGIIKTSTEIPVKYLLSQNYPNPFNPMTNVKFSMLNAGNVKIVVCDIQGREVQTLVNERLSEGTYEVKFDGSMLNSGVYFYRMVSGEFTETKRMLLLK